MADFLDVPTVSVAYFIAPLWADCKFPAWPNHIHRGQEGRSLWPMGLAFKHFGKATFYSLVERLGVERLAYWNFSLNCPSPEIKETHYGRNLSEGTRHNFGRILNTVLGSLLLHVTQKQRGDAFVWVSHLSGWDSNFRAHQKESAYHADRRFERRIPIITVVILPIESIHYSLFETYTRLLHAPFDPLVTSILLVLLDNYRPSLISPRSVLEVADSWELSSSGMPLRTLKRSECISISPTEEGMDHFGSKLLFIRDRFRYKAIRSSSVTLPQATTWNISQQKSRLAYCLKYQILPGHQHWSMPHPRFIESIFQSENAKRSLQQSLWTIHQIKGSTSLKQPPVSKYSQSLRAQKRIWVPTLCLCVLKTSNAQR